jgi:SnoaL-like domain
VPRPRVERHPGFQDQVRSAKGEASTSEAKEEKGTIWVIDPESFEAFVACWPVPRGGGDALAPVFADLNQYDATTHFVGQSTIFTLTGDRATGEAYCLAHHVTVGSGKRRLMVASLRYLDTFVKIDGAWLFAERLLYVDWLEERALS